MKPDRIDGIYEELGKLSIELDPDPASRGPLYLQDLISKTRGYLNQVSLFMQEVLREQRRVEMELRGMEDAFEISSNELLTSDHRVKPLPSIEDRNAMIAVILKDDRRAIIDLRREQKDLEHVFKVVRHCQKELNDTMSAIRLQRSLIAAELQSGSFYGDENNASRGTTKAPRKKVSPGGIDDFDEEVIRELLGESKEATPVVKERPVESKVDKEDPGIVPQGLSTTDNWGDFLDSILDSPGEAMLPETPSEDGDDPAIARFLNEEVDIASILDGV